MLTDHNHIHMFISYAHEDEPLLRQLETHLSLLKRQGLISTWYDRQVAPGRHRAQMIDEWLEQASIILLLVSPEFLASDYCYEVEMKLALERHEAGQARIIPIIARSCDWRNAPFAHIQGLPTDSRPITTWHDRDKAWTAVAQGIRLAIKDLALQAASTSPRVHFSVPLLDMLSPEVWNVPRRHNAFFTGRAHVLQQLADDFQVEGGIESAPPQAITGLAGMGKTQTAAEYAYRFRKNYRAVLWVRSQTQDDLITDFKTIAHLLKIPREHIEDRAILLQTLHEWFRHEKGWLLIFDNADDLTLVEPFIPPMGPGHVLLTTRVGATVQLAQTLELQSLTVEDGALCLLRRAGLLRWNKELEDALPEYVDAAQELARLMNGLPLALEQAGAYINDTKCGVRRYFELYKLYRPKLHQIHSGMIPDYAVPVASALMISSLMIGRESATFELLQLCAFLAPEGIPDKFVTLAAPALGPMLSPIADDPIFLDQIIRPLVRYSLLEREEQSGTGFTTLSIHRILQLVLLDEMDTPTRQLWAERATRALILALQTMMWSVLQAHARHCLDYIEYWHLSVPEAKLLQTYFKEI